MIEKLDQQVFLFLNSLNSPFWDNVMYLISGRLTWVPIYLAILIVLGFRYKRKFLIILVVIALGMTFTDQAALLIKNLVERPRPCHEPDLEGLVHIVRNRCGGQFGFVSSHAANSFAVALLSLQLIRKSWFSWLIVIWALTVGYSRIYLGVHYPGDVLCGSLLGAFSGWLFISLYKYIDARFLEKSGYFTQRNR